jgi:hypothetical protein
LPSEPISRLTIEKPEGCGLDKIITPTASVLVDITRMLYKVALLEIML